MAGFLCIVPSRLMER